jgi:hypothetical protein
MALRLFVFTLCLFVYQAASFGQVQTEHFLKCTLDKNNAGPNEDLLVPCASKIKVQLDYTLPANTTIRITLSNNLSVGSDISLNGPFNATTINNNYSVSFDFSIGEDISGLQEFELELSASNIYPTLTNEIASAVGFKCEYIIVDGEFLNANYYYNSGEDGAVDQNLLVQNADWAQFNFFEGDLFTINVDDESVSAYPSNEVTRTFEVLVHSKEVNTFNLLMNQEGDADNQSLSIVPCTGCPAILPFTILTAGNSESPFNEIPYSINLDDYADYLYFDTEDPNSRVIKFEQKVIVPCSSSTSTSDLTQITVSADCEQATGTTVGIFNVNVIDVNPNLDYGNYLYSLLSNSLAPHEGTNGACPGEYEYTFKIGSAAVNTQLLSFRLPYNGNYFEVVGASINDIEISNYQDYLHGSGDNSNFSFAFDQQPSGAYFELGHLVNLNDGEHWLPVGNDFSVTLKLELKCEKLHEDFPLSPLSLLIQADNKVSITGRTQCGVEITLEVGENIKNKIFNGRHDTFYNSVLSGGTTGMDILEDEPKIFNYIFTSSSGNINIQSDPLTMYNNTTVLQIVEPVVPLCSTRYRAVVRFAENLIGFVSVTGGGFAINSASANTYESNLEEVELGIPTGFSFEINLSDCPFEEEGNTFGSMAFTVEVQAYCADCEECYRILNQRDELLMVHCQGDCDGNVVVHTKSVDIQRTTFGWKDLQDFIDHESDPIDSKAELKAEFDLDEVQMKNELHKVYPFDEVEITATGKTTPVNEFSINNDLSNTLTKLGFEITYTAIPDHPINNIFDLIPATAEIEYGILPEDENLESLMISSYEYEYTITSSLDEGFEPPAGFEDQNLDWVRIKLLVELPLSHPLTTGNYAYIGFRAKFSVDPGFSVNVDDVSSFPLVIRGQFINENNSGAFETSCDPWGTDLLVLVPGYEISQAAMITPGSHGNLPFSYEVEFDSPAVNKNVGTFLSANNCNSNLITGIRLHGGLGLTTPDFIEYRPFLKWPNLATVTDLSEVYNFYSLTENYNILGDQVSNQDITRNFLLPPTVKGIGHQINGLVFRVDKDCTIDPQIYNINFDVYHHAYLPIDHDQRQPVDWAAVTISPNSSNANQFCHYVNGEQELHVPNSFNYPFNFTSNEKYGWLYYEIESEDASAGPISELESFEAIPDLPNFYYFPDGFPQNPATGGFQIPVQIGCNSSYNLKIYSGVFCNGSTFNELQVNPETIISNNPCNVCSTEVLLNRNSSSEVYFTPDVSLVKNDCQLVWSFELDNPDNSPSLASGHLSIEVPLGLLVENSQLTTHIGGTSETTTLDVPFPILTTLSGAGLVNSLVYNVPELPSGSNFVFEISFSLTEPLCQLTPPPYQIPENLFSQYLKATYNSEPPCAIDNAIERMFTKNLNGSVSEIISTEGCCTIPGELVTAEVTSQSCGSGGQITVTIEDYIPNVEYTITYTNESNQYSRIADDPITIIEDLNPGTYALVVFRGNAQISQFPNLEVVEITPPVSSLTSSTNICDGVSYTPVFSPSGGVLVINGELVTSSSVTLSGPGTYPYTYSVNYENCISTLTGQFEVLPRPVTTITSATGCSDSPIGLTVTNAEGVTLSTGSISITSPDPVTVNSSNVMPYWTFTNVPTGSTSITFTYTDQFGCTDASPNTINTLSSNCVTCVTQQQ